MNIPKPAKRGNKYGAKKTPCRAGHIHDSKKEAGRCDELHLLLRGGVITDLTFQRQFYFTINGQVVKHPGGRRVGIKVDFSYFEAGRECVEECKGMKVRDYVLRVAIFRALYPDIDFRETISAPSSPRPMTY